MRVPLLFLVAVAACHKPAPEPTITPTDAEAVTGKYFYALAAGDCDGIRGASVGSLRNKIVEVGCDKAFEEAKSHGLVYVGSGNVRPDGRDDRARLIDIRIQTDGKEKTVVGRLEIASGAWGLAGL